MAQWRGPDMTGVSNTARPPVAWSETKNIKWRVEIPGRGSASPLAWGDRVFLLTAVPAGVNGPGQHAPRGALPQRGLHQYTVLAIDRKTGKIVWEGPGTTMNLIPSPVSGHGMVFIMSGFRGNNLMAIRLADAKGDISAGNAIAWQLDLDTPDVPSPLLYGNMLYFLKTNNGLLSAPTAASTSPAARA